MKETRMRLWVAILAGGIAVFGFMQALSNAQQGNRLFCFLWSLMFTWESFVFVDLFAAYIKAGVTVEEQKEREER